MSDEYNDADVDWCDSCGRVYDRRHSPPEKPLRVIEAELKLSATGDISFVNVSQEFPAEMAGQRVVITIELCKELTNDGK